ncbi:hypothetical protein, partial [Bacillus cereus]|uniref:hypothetical protein n=1 Tax=Bacillus cereus TaxID=1396 RepID=UPI0034D6868E
NLNEVKPTDFIDGFDVVDKAPKSTNENGLLQPCSNTKLAYDLGEAVAGVKQYRLTMNLTSLASCDLLFDVSINGLFSNFNMVTV